jgi:hypothetical protein
MVVGVSESTHTAPPGPGKVKGHITIPGVGKLPTWAVAGGLGLVVILIIRHRSAASSAAAAGPAVTTDPAGNVGVIDPATGFVVGSAEDTAALAGSSGSDGSGADTSGDVSVGDQVTNGPPFTSNAAWSQYAISVLTTQNYDGATLANELGAYLNGAAVTAAQRDDINAAIAVAGLPPVAGAGGMPPSINVSGSVAGGGASGGSTGGGSSSGSPAPAGGGGPITVTPVNLKESHVYATSLQVTWLAPTIPAGQGPLTGYGVAAYEAATGKLVNGPFTVGKGQLYANVGGLKSKTKYNVNVWCDPAKTGGPHANVEIETL